MRFFEQAPARDPISQMLYVDTKTYLSKTSHQG